MVKNDPQKCLLLGDTLLMALVEASQETLVYKTVFHWIQKCIPELLEFLKQMAVRASSLHSGTQKA